MPVKSRADALHGSQFHQHEPPGPPRRSLGTDWGLCGPKTAPARAGG
jgi:hypothetical protein